VASLNLNRDVRLMAMGIKVSRATAALPQSATGNIFTITGGRIFVFALIGEVTTALGATATTLKVSSLPTIGSSLDLCTALTVTSFAAGVHFSLPSAAGSALVSDTGTGAGVQDIATSPWMLPAGAITITTSASDTGSVKWDVVYVPLDDGVQVAAA
jgi:hypothetical protein